MRLKKSIFLVFLIGVFGCNDSQDFALCNVNSVDELDWLKEELESKGYFQPSFVDVSVYRAKYLGLEVVYISICCPDCLVVPPEIRSCSGESLGLLDVDINSNLLTNKKVIWRSDNGFCS